MTNAFVAAGSHRDDSALFLLLGPDGRPDAQPLLDGDPMPVAPHAAERVMEGEIPEPEAIAT